MANFAAVKQTGSGGRPHNTGAAGPQPGYRGGDFWREELNEDQYEAVSCTGSPQLVIAGAGSGKTRVLTYKVAYLIAHGADPGSILALTFTNKAAGEMKARVAAMVGEATARRIDMGTFHSVFARILRREAAATPFTPDFTIYDEADSKALVKTIVKELGLDPKAYDPKAVRQRISMAKNHLVGAAQYAATPDFVNRDRRAQTPRIADIFSIYESRCRTANAMDFDDLLVHTHSLFAGDAAVLGKYAGRYAHILVDEYQDTNHAQQCILRQLTGSGAEICAVGDDSQSIYGFRGADVDNILGFRRDYPGAKLFKLERNYRSTQNIVAAAASLIGHNTNKIDKRAYSLGDKGERVRVAEAHSDREEASIVRREIARRVAAGWRHSDFAVLYRTNSQSRSFEEEFGSYGTPFRVYGGLGFYQRKEVKDAAAYFRLSVNPDDDEAFRRVANYPKRGIGDTSLARLSAAAAARGASLAAAAADIREYCPGMAAAAAAKLAAFASMAYGFHRKQKETDAYTLAVEIMERSGMKEEVFSSAKAEDVSRQENLEEFLAAIHGYVDSDIEENGGAGATMSQYLQSVSLLSDTEDDEDGGDKVSLMTVHAAKGLEFPYVFIVGVEQGIFPGAKSAASLRGMEEERRLMYVAMTRAEKCCMITYARQRFRFGHVEEGAPSCFIAEIDPSLLDTGSAAPAWTAKRGDTFASFMADRHGPALRPVSKLPARTVEEDGGKPLDPALKVGSMIEHQRFGIGRVTAMEGSGQSTKATVEFVNQGTKQLLLKFAKYDIIG